MGLEFNAYKNAKGTNSMGDLIELPGGELFGTNVANIFRFNITTKTFTSLFDVNPFDRGMPYAGLLAVNKQPQELTFEPIGGKKVGDADFALSASSSLGLPITFHSSNPAAATVDGHIVKIIGSGSATITARQAGTIVIAAVEEEQTVIVNKADQTITFHALSS